VITPYPVKTPPLEGHLLNWIWGQWLNALRAAVNGTPGNSTPTLFANLPTPVAGMIYVVTDSTVNTWGAVVAGGGGFTVGAFFNGTNWTVAAI
jgi:hypothetical protein